MLKIIKIGFFDAHRKKSEIWSSAFYVDGCVSLSIKVYESSWQLHNFSCILTTIIMKKSVKDIPLGGLRLKTAGSQQTRSKHKA